MLLKRPRPEPRGFFLMTYSEVTQCHFVAILATSKSPRPAQIQREEESDLASWWEWDRGPCRGVCWTGGLFVATFGKTACYVLLS